MNRYLALALTGIGFLILALVLSFIAMSGTAIHRTYSEEIHVVPNASETLDVWSITGAFSRNVTLLVDTNCEPLKLVILEGIGKGRVVKELRVYNRATVTGLDRLVSPKVILEANESCFAKLTLSFYYVQAMYAWLSVPALLSMVIGAALLLIGGSAYTAYKLRFGKLRASK